MWVCVLECAFQQFVDLYVSLCVALCVCIYPGTHLCKPLHVFVQIACKSVECVPAHKCVCTAMFLCFVCLCVAVSISLLLWP